MDVIMFWLGVWHRSLVWLPLLDDWSDYLYHLFALLQQQLNCLWISSWLLTVANLTIKVSGPWSLFTSWCRPVWATKEVLKEGRGQQSLRKQYKEELGTANSSGVLVHFTDTHLSMPLKSLQLILKAVWCISNECCVFSFHWNTTILWKHLALRMLVRTRQEGYFQPRKVRYFCIALWAVSWFCQFFILNIHLMWTVLLSSAELLIWIWS